MVLVLINGQTQQDCASGDLPNYSTQSGRGGNTLPRRTLLIVLALSVPLFEGNGRTFGVVAAPGVGTGDRFGEVVEGGPARH